INDHSTLLLQSISLVGKPLPELKYFQIESQPDISNKIVLVCFFDIEQRPSRSSILELNKNANELKSKDIEIIAIQASTIEQEYLDKWLKENSIDFPVGMIKANPSTSLGTGEEQTIFNWGVKALPWLILTDKEHIVMAEGFSLNELDEKIKR
ncbi:MAG: redoxin domain-containing protein, partial [Sedimentisphaerales bacterium]|nr:redoxin domain-containing protein [Sedimentisphaerales bacterium]